MAQALIRPRRAVVVCMCPWYPEALRDEIDRINAFIYVDINNGVYRCGFASSQTAYE